MMGVTIGALAFLAFVNAVWLALWSDVFSRILFRHDRPLVRSVKCSLAAYAFGWVIAAVLAAIFGSYFLHVTWMGLAVGLAALGLVFLWEWRSFNRHWTPEDGPVVAEIFE